MPSQMTFGQAVIHRGGETADSMLEKYAAELMCRAKTVEEVEDPIAAAYRRGYLDGQVIGVALGLDQGSREGFSEGRREARAEIKEIAREKLEKP